MAENKKVLPPKVAAMKARKRSRLDTDTDASQKRPLKPTSKRRKVDVNSLAWKDVTLPDRLEDYEGFFGLEELDDVEVMRDEETGTVSYHSKYASVPNGTGPDSTALETEEDDNSTWSGFDDEPTEILASKPVTSENISKRAKADSKTHRTKSQCETSANGNGNFAALSNDDETEAADVSAWKPLKLSPDVMASLAKLRFTKPTPIQQAVVPEALKGHDIVGKASTGSGKTLAFGIPILERFLENSAGFHGTKCARSAPLALILSPTRELAHQLGNHLGALFAGIHARKPLIATVTGGLSLQKQRRLLEDADVVIGTPGRLWEIISSGKGVMAALKGIDFLVIDEADRLLSEGHFKEVEEILNAIDREVHEESEDEDGAENEKSTAHRKHIAETSGTKRQTLVFSATFDRSLQKKLVGKLNRKDNLLGNKETMEYLLSKLNFREEAPKFLDVNPINQLATGLKEGLVECGGTEKDLYLYALLLLNHASRAMVFTNSISAVRRITPLLQNLQLNVSALHSGMPQKARLRSVERFSQSKPGNGGNVVLVATDVAARGLDIQNVDLVIHYHLPRAADMYVHRSGRTARAGQQGSSILICSPEEVGGVRRLVAKVHASSAVSRDENASDAAKQGYYIRTLDIDRRVVSRLKERATLAKKLADATMAKEKQHKEDDFMRAAAEELGVEYDSEEFEKQASGKRGRGSGRKKKEREARELSKAEVGAMKAELKQLLSQRVNVGVSERYLTSGNIDIDELLRQQDAGAGRTGEFLGSVGNFGLDDL